MHWGNSSTVNCLLGSSLQRGEVWGVDGTRCGLSFGLGLLLFSFLGIAMEEARFNARKWRVTGLARRLSCAYTGFTGSSLAMKYKRIAVAAHGFMHCITF